MNYKRAFLWHIRPQPLPSACQDKLKLCHCKFFPSNLTLYYLWMDVIMFAYVFKNVFDEDNEPWAKRVGSRAFQSPLLIGKESDSAVLLTESLSQWPNCFLCGLSICVAAKLWVSSELAVVRRSLSAADSEHRSHNSPDFSLIPISTFVRRIWGGILLNFPIIYVSTYGEMWFMIKSLGKQSISIQHMQNK